MTNEVQDKKRTVIATVVSNNMEKTFVASVVGKKKHPLYDKYVKYRTKFYVHDENNECAVGDVVEISFSRPHSKKKCWVLEQIIQKAVQV